MSLGVELDGTDSNGAPAQIPAEAALSAALAYVPVAETGSTVAKLIPDALAAKGSIGSTRVTDIDYTANVGDRQIEMRGMTAGRNIYLPNVDDFPNGEKILIGDFDGTCSPDRPINVYVGLGTGDTISGRPGLKIAGPFDCFVFYCGSSDVWIAR